MDQPIKSSPRDVFMYLFATIALYFSAWSVINLLLQYISVAFPDALNQYYQPGSSIRWSMAVLIIIFPAYLWVSRFLRRDLVSQPEKSELRVRRWLHYLTLFLSALLIIGDLVALIFNFLEGELSLRFLLKVLSVLAVAAAIFWYYLYDLRIKGVAFNTQGKRIVYALIVAVAVVALYGFVVAGSPFRQRLARFDEQRVMDLQIIQDRIVHSYWIQKNALPKTLEDLRDNISGYDSPLDPEFIVPYEYRSTGKLTFELCALFSMPSEENNSITKPAYPYGYAENVDNWNHPAGHYCFSRTIDPELYKPVNTIPAPTAR
jgi:Domain of unknown function (DUF5671)